MLVRMFPFIKASSIFRSRWIALAWVIFVCWMVVGLFGGAGQIGGGDTARTDVTGAAYSDADVEQLKKRLESMQNSRR